MELEKLHWCVCAADNITFFFAELTGLSLRFRFRFEVLF